MNKLHSFNYYFNYVDNVSKREEVNLYSFMFDLCKSALSEKK